MANSPRIWLDYRPVRIGWVIAGRDMARLQTVSSWSASLWGGYAHCVVSAHDDALADNLIRAFGVDILLPADEEEATAALIARFPHLHHHRWSSSIFDARGCEFADIRHAARRIRSHQDRVTEGKLTFVEWQQDDPLAGLLALMAGRYPTPGAKMPDYRAALHNAFTVQRMVVPNGDPIPASMLDVASPLMLTAYDLTHARQRNGWLAPGVILASVEDFDAMVLFWNLRAAGARVVMYDQAHGQRLKPMVEDFLAKWRAPQLSGKSRVNFWLLRQPPIDGSWRPDLDLTNLDVSPRDGRGETLWNGLNIEVQKPMLSAWHRDVVPTVAEEDGKAHASFALPDRPFSDDDPQALSQKFVVEIDAAQYAGPDSELTFETPFVPKLNEFYGRNFCHDYDSARSIPGRFGHGAIAVITAISGQRMRVDAFRVFDWMRAFFALCGMNIERSEAGLRCSRIITQLGGVQGARVLKIRGARELLRKYDVDKSFTRNAAITTLRDQDAATGVVGFDAFKHLYIEFRERGDLTPDDVLRYLLERRVFRAGLEFTCPNCELPSWMHLDDVKSRSACLYCDHVYDVTPQLKDRDWRYRRSGIFGRNDNQLGGVPVAVTLQQLGATIHDGFLMYSTAISFAPTSAAIEPCESDFLAIIAGQAHRAGSPLKIVVGEAKSEGEFDAQDVRKLGKLADAIPKDMAEVFILFSKTGTFSAAERALAQSLNRPDRMRVILWSRDELEPFRPFERSKDVLGQDYLVGDLDDMASATHRVYFSQPVAASSTPVPGSEAQAI